MESWLLWLIAAVILGAGEIVTAAFLLAPFAGGALLAAVVAGLDGGAFAQWAVFLLGSTAMLAALRPLARSHKRMPPQIRTGTAALVGKSATVTERIDSERGAVRIDGDVWTARPYDEDSVFEPGTRVSVMEIRGAIALVSE